MKKILFLLLSLTFIFSSCSKDDKIPPSDISATEARDSLYYLMNLWYYWNESMPVVTKEDYDDPYELMEAMKYSELDKWSFVADYNEFINEMQGTFVGHGYRIGVDDDLNARIAMIYPNSPLYKSGVRRGWIVKKINNTDIAPILISGDQEAYSNLMGESKEGVENTFLFREPDGTETTITDTKSTFTVNSVLLYDTLELKSGRAGHLVFESFIQPSINELATAFGYFKAHNVTDLILDLRYNGGGYLYVAQVLASYIAGNDPAAAQDIFARLMYNENMKAYNDSYLFKTTAYPLNLNRLIVITSRMTASASEAVMNGLAPFMDIVTIGDTTNGKPVGMNGWDVGEKYFFWPVTFKMVNKEDHGDFFAGIEPQAQIPDDITHDFDSREELCLREAIYYLENGSHSETKGMIFRRYPQYSERPAWMNNAFLDEN